MLAQGCFVVSADDFSSEPVAAQETQADTQSDAEAVDFDTDAVETTASSDDVTSGKKRLLPRTYSRMLMWKIFHRRQTARS